MTRPVRITGGDAVLSREARTSIAESWRDNVAPNHAGMCKFNMEEAARLPGGESVRLLDGRAVDVSNGCCREYVRMWVFARNLPTCCANLPGSPIAVNGGWPETPELRLLRKHMNTIVVAQAHVQTDLNAAEAVSGVSGLSKKTVRGGVGVGDLLDRNLWTDGGALFLAGVTTGTGGHAVGFDTRGGEFHFFDPDCAMFSCAPAGRREGIGAFVRRYYEVAGYTGAEMVRYARV